MSTTPNWRRPAWPCPALSRSSAARITQGAWVVIFDGEPPQPVWIPADAVDFEADGRSYPGGTEILRHSLELGALLIAPQTRSGSRQRRLMKP